MAEPLRIGSIQVLEPLGVGAHSTILHVRRVADSRDYALKIVPIDGADERKYLDQAEHEFRIARMLDHPSLIKVYALEVEKDWLFRPRKAQLLLEYVNGKTLDACPPIPLAMHVQIFEQVASALAQMHRRNVVHCDIKPSNILLSRTGQVKVIDFGMATIRGDTKDRMQGTP
jgi:serine/threonine protein kinase